MARREVQDRQFTIYLDSHEDLERWKKLAKPYTLNRWIMLQVERGIAAPKKTKDTDEVNALRKRNLELESENEALTARLEKIQAKEVEDMSKGPLPLDKSVVDLLKSGGQWSSARIVKELVKREMAVAEGDEDVNYYKDEGIDEGPALSLEPPPFNHSERLKAIKKTLEELCNLGLVKQTWQGWAWNK